MNIFKKSFAYALLLVAIAGTGFSFREDWKNLIFPFVPCAKPLAYSLGSFDERFGVSQEEFLSTLTQAEEVWEEAMGKELFAYSASGPLKINLTYDYRQEATDKLTEVSGAISEEKTVYEQTKTRYETMMSRYERDKRSYEAAAASYDSRKKEYEKSVDYWNDKGGAPKEEYEELEAEKESLNDEAAELNNKGAALNTLSKEVNRLANTLNELAKKLNIKVKTFNTIGASTGEEFNEGEYIRDEAGTIINVYQFEDRAKLLRLLQHELGHALGLSHVDDAEAIMYRLNTGTGSELTPDDSAELKAVCQPSL